MTSILVHSRLRRTFPSIPKNDREWSAFLSNLFLSRQYTASLGGCTTSPTVTVTYTVSAGIVVVHIPRLVGTSNSTSAIITPIPDEIVASRTHVLLHAVINNGVTALGQVIVAQGIAFLELDTGITNTTGGFTASGTKGIEASTLVYALD